MPLENWSEDVCVVRLADDPQFTEELAAAEQHLNHHRRVDVVLDFTGVSYLNSTNISRLLMIRQQMIQNDSKLILCSISTRLWSTFLATGLDKVFTFSNDVSTALATLQMA